MKKGRELIRATMSFVEEDRKKSWFHFGLTLLLISIAWTFNFLDIHWILRVLTGVITGLLLSRLFVIYHDYRHQAILSNSTVAEIIMTIFGFLSLTPASIWDETHEHHHTHNSKFTPFVIGSFPTITKKQYLDSSGKQRFKYLLLRHPLMILFAYIPVFLISFCLWPFFENPKKYWDCGIAVILHSGLGAFIYLAFGWMSFLLSFIIPFAVMFAMGAYIFYAQHNFPSVVLQNDEDWDYIDAALRSSSYIKMNPLMQWLSANIGFHHIHHINSRIPFYRLPEVMQSLPELQNPGTTSLHPIQIWKCLQLKLWDEEKQKMISLSDLDQ